MKTTTLTLELLRQVHPGNWKCEHFSGYFIHSCQDEGVIWTVFERYEDIEAAPFEIVCDRGFFHAHVSDHVCLGNLVEIARSIDAACDSFLEAMPAV